MMMTRIILLALFGFVATDAKGCGKKAMCSDIKKLKERVKELEKEVHDLKEGPKDYSLHFPKIGTTDYVSIDGMPDLEAITACVWMRSSHQLSGENLIPLFSYATSGSDNELLFYMREKYLRVMSTNSSTQTVDYDVNKNVTDGQWHHLCLTWESCGGAWNISKDGEQLGSGFGFRTDKKIAGGGLLVLGQEQDKVGGCFDPNQSLVGHLSSANVWNRVLNAQEISELSKSCLAGEGNVFQWSEFRSERHGKVVVNAPSQCQA